LIVFSRRVVMRRRLLEGANTYAAPQRALVLAAR
jgi:hypothetical protein